MTTCLCEGTPPLKSPRPRAFVFLLVLAVPLADGCSGSDVQEFPPLPFHVAIVPARVATRATPRDVEADREVLEIGLDLKSERVSDTIQKALDGPCFVRSTLLSYPEDRDEFLGRGEAEQDAHWLEQARRQGVDVLLVSELRYDAAIESSQNDKFWLNLPLFLLGGPFSYLVDDRSYFADARLDVVLYDLTFELTNLEESNREMLDQWVRAEFEETSLSLMDRAEGDVGAYVLSLFVPASFVSTESEEVKEKVEEAVMEALAADLTSKIRSEASRLNANRTLSSFSLDLERVQVARLEDGTVAVNVPVRLLLGSRGVSDYEIRAHDMPTVAGAFRAGPDAEGLYWIREQLPIPRTSRWVRLRIADNQGQARAYTFQVDSY